MPAFCNLFLIKDDEIDEDDIEGNKPLTMEEFRQKAFEKLEVKFIKFQNKRQNNNSRNK